MKRTFIARSLVLLLLLGGFSYLSWWLLETAPRNVRERPAAATPLLDVVEVDLVDAAISVPAFGEVAAVQRLQIRPQVGGQLLALHPDFEPGGFIPAGETILQVDRRDYELAVDAARAEVAKAQAAIAIEQGRRTVAKEEFGILGKDFELDERSRDLALRKPQLRQVRAELSAAGNGLEQAQQDLARTAFSLPYDVIVLSRTRGRNEVVAERELIGEVAQANVFWLHLKLAPQLIARLRARDRNAGQAGSASTVLYSGQRYPAEVVRILPELAADSRLGGIILAVRDPLSRLPEHKDRPPLLIGSYVEAQIDAGLLRNVLRAPVQALRDNGRLFVVDAGDRLQVRKARVAWKEAHAVLLHPTLEAGDRLVVNRNVRLVPGTAVRVRAAQRTTP